MTPMLTLTGVDAGYSGFQALFGVSLEVGAGEAVAVIGPNGAGKTTLMRVISGMLAADAGEVTFDGRALTRLPAHRVVAAGRRPCTGEPAPLFPAYGRGEPADGRLRRLGAPGFRRAPRLGLCTLSAPLRAPPAARRNHVGPRAADVRDRPRTDVEAAAAADGRTLGRPGAVGGRA